MNATCRFVIYIHRLFCYVLLGYSMF